MLRDRAAAAFWALAVPVLLRLAGLEPTRRLLAPRRVRPHPVAEVLSAARIVDRRPVRWAVRPRCLARSLVLWRLLRSAGHGAEVVIGFRRPGGGAAGRSRGFVGHAWVEVGGRPLADPENLAAYEEVTRLGAAGFTRAGPGDRLRVSS